MFCDLRSLHGEHQPSAKDEHAARETHVKVTQVAAELCVQGLTGVAPTIKGASLATILQQPSPGNSSDARCSIFLQVFPSGHRIPGRIDVHDARSGFRTSCIHSSPQRSPRRPSTYLTGGLKGDTLKRETMEESARKRRASSVPAPQNKRKLSLVLGER